MNKKIIHLVLLLGATQALFGNDAEYQNFLRKNIKAIIEKIEIKITKENKYEQLDKCVTTKQLEALLGELNKKLAQKK